MTKKLNMIEDQTEQISNKGIALYKPVTFCSLAIQVDVTKKIQN